MRPQLLFLIAIFCTTSCEWDSVNTTIEEWVDVTYVTPVYETASSLADQVVIEEPKEQTSLAAAAIKAWTCIAPNPGSKYKTIIMTFKRFCSG